jgi:hypothetical protein
MLTPKKPLSGRCNARVFEHNTGVMACRLGSEVQYGIVEHVIKLWAGSGDLELRTYVGCG